MSAVKYMTASEAKRQAELNEPSVLEREFRENCDGIMHGIEASIRLAYTSFTETVPVRVSDRVADHFSALGYTATRKPSSSGPACTRLTISWFIPA